MIYECTLARQVLEDCRHALHELRQNPQGQAWRVRWFGTIALLRAVGHVLEKDCQAPGAPPSLRTANERWWSEVKASKPEPEIFWHFIERDRNALLKEYALNASQSVTIHMTGIWNPDNEPVTFEAPPVRYERLYTIHNGPFSGKDHRDVVEQAINWWDEQLREIAIRAAAEDMKDISTRVTDAGVD